MSNLEKFNDHVLCDELYSISVSRRPDGRLLGIMSDAKIDWIEESGDNVADRLRSVASDMKEVARSFEETAMRLDETVANEG